MQYITVYNTLTTVCDSQVTDDDNNSYQVNKANRTVPGTVSSGNWVMSLNVFILCIYFSVQPIRVHSDIWRWKYDLITPS